MRYLMPYVGFFLIYFIGATCRLKVLNRHIEDSLLDKKINPVYALWHGRLLYFSYLYRWQRKHNILVSPSPDGEIIGNILKLFGFFVIWGSSFKQGGRALLSLFRKARKSESVVLIADGSRGPAFIAQQGTISVSMLTGLPIVPMTYSADKKKILGSWDRLLIPFPFSNIVVIYGMPVYVPRDADIEMRELKRKELEDELNAITMQADRYFV